MIVTCRRLCGTNSIIVNQIMIKNVSFPNSLKSCALSDGAIKMCVYEFMTHILFLLSYSPNIFSLCFRSGMFATPQILQFKSYNSETNNRSHFV